MTKPKPRFPSKPRHQVGMSPSQRAQIDADAKKVAVKFTWAAKSRNAPAIQAITATMTRADLIALALNLAEGISPGDHRLLEVTRVPGDGIPLGVTRSEPHRRAKPPEAERTSASSERAAGDLGADDAAA